MCLSMVQQQRAKETQYRNRGDADEIAESKESSIDLESKEMDMGDRENVEPVKAPKSLDELMKQMLQRIRFMSQMRSSQDFSSTGGVSLPMLVEKWSDTLRPVVLSRWKSAQNKVADKKWGGVATMLKAQRKLRKTKSGTLSYEEGGLIPVDTLNLSFEGKAVNCKHGVGL